MYDVFKALLSEPYVWFWLLLVFFAILRWKHSRGDHSLVIIGLVIIWFLGMKPLPHILVKSLEDRYHPPSISELRNRQIKHIVILSGGETFRKNKELITSQFSNATLLRMIGGLELAAELGDGIHIICSGGSRHLKQSRMMAEFGKKISPQQLFFAHSGAHQTSQHPNSVRPFVEDRSFVLVTSAVHMPRAMLYFKRAGMEPIPYPVAYAFSSDFSWRDLIPKVGNLRGYRSWLYETEGLLLAMLTKD